MLNRYLFKILIQIQSDYFGLDTRTAAKRSVNVDSSLKKNSQITELQR